MEGEGNESGRDREASSEGSSDIAPEDEEVESVTSSSDAETSEEEPAEAMPRASSTKGKSDTRGESSTPIPSGRATSSVQSTGSVQSGVSFDPQGRVLCGEGLADAPTAPLSAKMSNSSRDSASHGTNEQFAALRAGEEKRLAKNV